MKRFLAAMICVIYMISIAPVSLAEEYVGEEMELAAITADTTSCDHPETTQTFDYGEDGVHCVRTICLSCESELYSVWKLCADPNGSGICEKCGAETECGHIEICVVFVDNGDGTHCTFEMCDECGMVGSEEVFYHCDNDSDDLCDYCEASIGCVHGNTYIQAKNLKDGTHSLHYICDTCEAEISSEDCVSGTIELCKDENSDDICDVCNATYFEKIYYSDLFFGYSPEYLSHGIHLYTETTFSVLQESFDDYADSMDYYLTGVGGALSDRLFSYLSDAVFGTQFTYNDALDNANLRFLAHLYKEPYSDWSAQYGVVGGIEKRANEMAKLWEDFEKKYDTDNMSTAQMVTSYFVELDDTDIISQLSTVDMNNIKGHILQKPGEFLGLMGNLADIQGALQTMTTALILEDVKLETLKAMRDSVSSGSTLYRGMNRLIGQLESDFHGYFWSTYAVDKGMELLYSWTTDFIAKNCPVYGFAKAVLNVGKLLILDMLLNVPTVEEALEQRILTEYTTDLGNAIWQKISIFETEPFIMVYWTLDSYELLIDALTAATDAALEATEPIARGSYGSQLMTIQAAWGDYSYGLYITGVMNKIRTIKPQDRALRTWNFEWDRSVCPGVYRVTIQNASDWIESDNFYLFKDQLNADVSTKCMVSSLRVGEDVTAIINGDVTVEQSKLEILQGADVTVNGDVSVKYYMGKLYNNADLTINGDLSVLYDEAEVHNSGRLTVTGDLTIQTNNTRNYAYIFSDSEDAQWIIGGDFTAERIEFCDELYNKGKVIFNGSGIQNIKNLCAYDILFDGTGEQHITDMIGDGMRTMNVEFGGTARITIDGLVATGVSITNPRGVKYLSNISTLSFAANGNPIDCGKYYVYTSILKGDACNFGNVALASGNHKIPDGSAFENLEIYRCVIEGNITYTVNEDLVINEGGFLANNGKLRVKGDFIAEEGAVLHNYNTMTVDGDFSNKYTYTTEEVVYTRIKLTVGGDMCIKGKIGNNGDIIVGGDVDINIDSGGLTVGGNVKGTIDVNDLKLNGTSQQKLYGNIDVSYLAVENPEGIQYNTNVYITYLIDLNGSVLDSNGYRTILRGGWLAGGDDVYGEVEISEGYRMRLIEDVYRADFVVYGTMNVPNKWSERHVIGDVTIASGGVLENSAEICVQGGLYLHGTYNQIEDDASIEIVGDFCGTMREKYLNYTIINQPIEDVETMIAALDRSSSEEELAQAEAAYDALSDLQKELVSNASKLTDALEGKLYFTVAGTNMSLGNALEVNFLFLKKDVTGTGHTAIVTQQKADGTTKVTEFAQADWGVNGSYYLIPIGVAAKEMADVLTVEILDAEGNVCNNAYSTSVREYGGKALASSTTSNYMKILVVDMLNYGAAAQVNFEYNTEDLANKLLTEEQKATATSNVECGNFQVKGTNCYGANLNLTDRIEMNIYFSGMKNKEVASMYAIVSFTNWLGEEKNITVPGSEFIKLNSSIYGVVVDDIVLADVKQLVTVTVYNADGTVHGTGSDSVESYANRGAATAAAPLYADIMKFAASAYIYLTNR